MMKTCFRALALLLSGLSWNCPASAQAPGSPLPGAAPQPSVPPVMLIEGNLASPCETPKKVCVTEPKKNTKVVYNSRCQEYCLPRCGTFLDWIHGRSCESCKCGDCGPVRMRHVLVKKKVPDCDTMTCVLKDVPACETPTMATPAPSLKR